MVRLVEGSWLEDRLREPELAVVDARPAMRYLSGHVPNALSIPTEKAFGPDGLLLPEGALADWLGRSGLSSQGTVVLYADSDYQHAALMAWILDYLGHPDVAFLAPRFEDWTQGNGKVSYRPVAAGLATFEARPRPELRANWQDVVDEPRSCLVDTRSAEEFRGDKVVADDPPGHIPGAVNVPWLSFLDENGELLLCRDELSSRLRLAGAELGPETVVYCRAALRASVAWLAIRLVGGQVRLYDGSFLEWSRRAEGAAEIGGVVHPVAGVHVFHESQGR